MLLIKLPQREFKMALNYLPVCLSAFLSTSCYTRTRHIRLKVCTLALYYNNFEWFPTLKMSLAPVYSLSPFLPSLPFPIPKPCTVISFMEQRQSKAENATNDITLSLNKHMTHGIIIKGGMETPGCLSNVTIYIATPPPSCCLQCWWEIH